MLLILASLQGCGSTCEDCQVEQRIPLTYEMIVNESAVGNGINLVDEQFQWKSGELTFEPQRVWRPEFTWNESLYIAIDLLTTHRVHSLSLYRAVALLDRTEAAVSVYVGEPFTWQPLIEKQTVGRNGWQQIAFPPVTTRYLRLKLEGGKVNIGELFLFGEPTGQEPPAATSAQVAPAKPRQETTFDEMTGVNAFVDDPIGRYDFFGLVREYHNWRWVEHEEDLPYPGNVNHWNPGDSKWNFDALYQNLDRLDIAGCPSIKENLKWLRKNHWEINTKPLLPEANPEDPRSYIAHADHLFQYAARYGHTEVADSLLKLADNQPRKSGLGYLRYFENWNEQDIWWKYRGEYFSPYEFAAMSSADYDGHQQALGTTVGLKNADSTAQLVMGGLAALNFDYVRAMKFWADHHRGGSFPADVLNFHHYSNYKNGDERYAISPEADSLQAKLEALARYRDQYLPGRELWLTEFGYDTHSASPQGVPSIDGFTNEEVQGMWLVRSLLAAAAARIDRTAIYMLRDVKDGDPSLYNTCGITSSKHSGWQPKPAWYYLKTFAQGLKGMQFAQSMPATDPKVMVYKFVTQDSNQNKPRAAYVVWCPTATGEVVENYELELASQEKHGILVNLSNNTTGDIHAFEAAKSGSVRLSVSEKPTLILVGNEEFGHEDVFSEKRQLVLTPEMITYVTETTSELNPSEVQNTGLVDEQQSIGDPLLGQGSKTKSNWKTTGVRPDDYPYSAIIDLGEATDLSFVSFFDINDDSNLSIYTGKPGDWKPVVDDDLLRFNQWSNYAINESSRFVRVTKHSPTAHVGEIVIYSKR
jgi:hypothetical protein